MYQLAKSVLSVIDENFIGIFLYGSQNYCLSSEESDLDAILLIKEDSEPYKKINHERGTVKIYTIKYFLYRLQKGDMECYEILYTKHRFVAEQYIEVFDVFVESFTKIINFDRIKHSLSLKLREHLACINWLPTNPNKEAYHRKRAYWSYRVFDQLKRVLENEKFEKTFVYNEINKEELLRIKKIPNYLSPKKLSDDIKKMVLLLKSLPKYNIGLTDAESTCLSNFYNKINSI